MTRKAKFLHLAALTGACAAMIASASEVLAQTRNCGPRDIVLSRLADKYKESRQSMGLGANNQVMEVFASDETGSWTITVTLPNGMTCLVASGQSFEALTEALPVTDEDA